jgi:hypothetical protein
MGRLIAARWQADFELTVCRVQGRLRGRHGPPRGGSSADGTFLCERRTRQKPVALASEMARMIWALLTKNEDYRAPTAVAV